MNKFKVGQKVKIKATQNTGKILEIRNVDINNDDASCLNYYVKFIDNNLIKRRFFTVHDLEEEGDILDLEKEEKEYLNNVIKPFKNKIENIEKCKFYQDGLEEFISIRIKNNYSIDLPNFKKNTMYKKMKIGKAYTLEELGL